MGLETIAEYEGEIARLRSEARSKPLPYLHQSVLAVEDFHNQYSIPDTENAGRYLYPEPIKKNIVEFVKLLKSPGNKISNGNKLIDYDFMQWFINENIRILTQERSKPSREARKWKVYLDHLEILHEKSVVDQSLNQDVFFNSDKSEQLQKAKRDRRRLGRRPRGYNKIMAEGLDYKISKLQKELSANAPKNERDMEYLDFYSNPDDMAAGKKSKIQYEFAKSTAKSNISIFEGRSELIQDKIEENNDYLEIWTDIKKLDAEADAL